MNVDTTPATAPNLVDEGRSAFCHVVCGLHEDRTLCGLTDESDTWCTDDPCNNTCAVCADLEETASACPICGTVCGPTCEH